MQTCYIIIPAKAFLGDHPGNPGRVQVGDTVLPEAQKVATLPDGRVVLHVNAHRLDLKATTTKAEAVTDCEVYDTAEAAQKAYPWLAESTEVEVEADGKAVDAIKVPNMTPHAWAGE